MPKNKTALVTIYACLNKSCIEGYTECVIVRGLDPKCFASAPQIVPIRVFKSWSAVCVMENIF